MRINKSSTRKVSTRRAHRPDQQTYRSMRRTTSRDARKLLAIELTVITLLLAALVGAAWYFFF